MNGSKIKKQSSSKTQKNLTKGKMSSGVPKSMYFWQMKNWQKFWRCVE